LAAGVALLAVGCLYWGYHLGQLTSRKIEIVAKRESALTQQEEAVRQRGSAGEKRVANERTQRKANTTPPNADVSATNSGVDEVQQARDLYIRGLKCLNDDDATCARLYFELGAERFRSGRNAVAMSDTFNPYRLSGRRIYGGVRPDIDKARKWYERARDLAPIEAGQRLRELDAARKGY
jgi:hypothetical protein